MTQANDHSCPAGIIRRLAAFFYDALLLVAVYFLIGAVAVLINGGNAIPRSISLVIALVIFPLVVFLFYCWFWRRAGQTLGMQAWRLKLVSNRGVIRNRDCLIRFITSLLSLACVGAGFWWMLFDVQKRTWHDIASNTRICHLHNS